MLSMKVRCPNAKCRVTLLIPEQLHGQQVRCAGCGEPFVVPPILPASLRLPREPRASQPQGLKKAG